ncbi:MAG: hypothetical protein K0S65_4740, partial [Labilithrix sp.]|nr:hypothetical protein [Labilithrix sp.]
MNGVVLRRSLALGGGGVGIFLVLAACANSDASSGDDSGDGGTVLPAVDASPEEDGRPLPDVSAPDGEAGVSVCSEDDFCHSLVPEGELLRGVWGDGQGVVWAVSTTGDVLRWDGTSWQVH